MCVIIYTPYKRSVVQKGTDLLNTGCATSPFTVTAKYLTAITFSCI